MLPNQVQLTSGSACPLHMMWILPADKLWHLTHRQLVVHDPYIMYAMPYAYIKQIYLSMWCIRVLILVVALLQGYTYDHVGGDLNDKITAEAQELLDQVQESVMEEFRERRSSWSSLICQVGLVIFKIVTDATDLDLGAENIEPGSQSPSEKLLIAMFGKKLFEEYMNVLDDPTCFKRIATCHHRSHSRQVLWFWISRFFWCQCRSVSMSTVLSTELVIGLVCQKLLTLDCQPRTVQLHMAWCFRMMTRNVSSDFLPAAQPAVMWVLWEPSQACWVHLQDLSQFGFPRSSMCVQLLGIFNIHTCMYFCISHSAWVACIMLLRQLCFMSAQDVFFSLCSVTTWDNGIMLRPSQLQRRTDPW